MDEQQIIERKIELEEALCSLNRVLEIEYSSDLDRGRSLVREELSAWCETHGLER